MLFWIRFIIQTLTPMVASVWISSRNSGVPHWQSLRSFCQFALFWLTQILMILLFLKLLIYTRAKGLVMRRQQEHGLKSMPWIDSTLVIWKPGKNLQFTKTWFCLYQVWIFLKSGRQENYCWCYKIETYGDQSISYDINEYGVYLYIYKWNLVLDS